MATTATAFPTFCSSSGDTAPEARQVGQVDAKCTIHKRQRGTGGVMAEHTAQAAMTDRGEEKVSHHLPVERRLVDLVPTAS
jgi:hypothetical protein